MPVILPEVDQQINSYLDHPNTLSLANSTQNSYRYILSGHLLKFCKAQHITHLDGDFLKYMENFVSYLLTKGINPYSIQHYLTVTKFFMLTMGHKIEFTYKIPRATKQAHDLKHQKRWFTDQDIARCKTYQFPKMHERNHVLVRLFTETGARIDEIAHIRRGDVSLERKTILLGHSKTIPRPVFFSQETGIFLEKFLANKYPDPAVDAFKMIFPGKNRIYKIMIAMMLDLKLKHKDDGRGPHTFRHYVATHLHHVKGMRLTSVAKLLGDTTDTISSRYLHPTAEMLQAEISQAAGWS